MKTNQISSLQQSGKFQSKSKGFTLIELLAIIVILAIIAVITVPVILNIIDSAKQGAAKNSALGYIKAVDNQLMVNGMDTNPDNDIRSDGTVTVESLGTTYGVTVNGEKPLNKSTVTFTNGEVTGYRLYISGYIITMTSGVVTVTKDDGSAEATNHVTGVDITDTNFELIVGQTKQLQFNISPTGATNNSVTWQSNHPEYATVSNTGFVTAMGNGIATITVTTGDGNFTDTVTVNVKEKYITDISNDCAKAGHTACSDTDIYNGVSMNVKVNSTTTEAFHVIADDGNILTLQMDSNIATGSGSEWYITPESSYSNLYGPVTALTKLHELTSDWTNVLPMKNYTYNEGNYTYGYQSAVWNTNGELTITGNASLDETKRTNIIGSASTPMRARMITAEEVASLIGDSGWNIGHYTGKYDTTPDWMKFGISSSKPYGYWTLGSYYPASYSIHAWYVGYTGSLYNYDTDLADRGVRPVINILKSDSF